MMRKLIQQNSGPPKFVLFIAKKATLVALICYIGAICYSYYATMPDVIENTRVSESAFMPGHVRTRFNKPTGLYNYAKGLRSAFKEGKSKEYIMNTLEDMDIEAYNQTYELYTTYNVKNLKKSGENIYGIIRTTKNPSVESMLLVVPLDESRIEGAALALTIADYFKDQVYWARDIIILFVDPSAVAMESWLSAFNGYSINNLKANPLSGRSGTIVGAYIFDLKGQHFDHVNLKFFGVNGRQPNLDLVNVVIQIFYQFGGTSIVNNIFPYHVHHFELINSFMQSIYKQTFKEIDGLHSVFGSYGISAVSIIGKPSRRQQHNEIIDLNHMAIIIESCYRSLNNILEKLHQSYFLYYLLSPRKFMSVAFYMIISAFFMLSMLSLSLQEYFKITSIKFPKAFVYNHLLSLGLYFTTIWIYSTNNDYLLNNISNLQEYILIIGPIINVILNLLYPLNDINEYIILRFILFVEVGILIGSTSLISISPGLIIGFIYVLPIIFITNIFNKIKFLATIGSLIFHPLSIIYFGQFILSYYRFEGYGELLKSSTPYQLAAKWTLDGLKLSIHKHLVHSSMLFPIYCIFILAISLHLVTISRFNGGSIKFIDATNKQKHD